MDTATFNWAEAFEQHGNLLREDTIMATAVAKRKKSKSATGESGQGNGGCPDPLGHILEYIEERKKKARSSNGAVTGSAGKQAASPAAASRAYRDQAGETGEVVLVVRGLGGVWISARGETGHHHRVKSPALPPRKTQAEAQQDLDAYAAKRGWQPVDSPNGSAIVVGPAVPILVPPRLNVNERKSLAKCERVIEGGMREFVEVGRALASIRDAKLYRETHDTFEAYCRDRWDCSRAQAYRLIDSACVVERLALPAPPIGDTRKKAKQPAAAVPMPVNEAQVRPITRVDADQQPEVWGLAVERAKAAGRATPTAAIVEAVVKEYTTPPDELPPKKDGAEARARRAEQAASSAATRGGCPDPAAWARECDELEQHVMRILGSYADWPGATAAMVDVLELLIERVEGE